MPEGHDDGKPRADDRLCLSQIKSEYIGDAARPGLEGEEYALPSETCAIGAHFCGRDRSSNA